MENKNLRVAVLNTTEEIVKTLVDFLTIEGYNAIGAQVTEFRFGRQDFVQFMENHDPQIIIYDLAPPYREQLNFLKILLNTAVMQGREIIYTTTNKKNLELEGGGVFGAQELLGKPFDLEQLLDKLKKAAESLAPNKKAF